MWGRDQRGNNTVCSTLTPLSVTSPTSHKIIVPFQVLPWCSLLGGLSFVHSRTLWAPPTETPVRLGVPPTATTPTDFYSQRFWGFVFPCWNPELCGKINSLLFLPFYLPVNVGLPSPPDTPCCVSSPPQLPTSTPPTGLDECFFSNSLVIGLSYTLIFRQFWLFLFLNWLLSFFWLYKETKHIYLCLHLGQKPLNILLFVYPFYYSLTFRLIHWRILYMNNVATNFIYISFGAHMFAYVHLGIKLLNNRICILVGNVK